MSASATPIPPLADDSRRQIRRALISVYDKTGLVELAQALHAASVEIVSTGSTAAKIAEAGIPVTAVDALTGFPECLEGRVKTLHPRVHAGILADTRKDDHLAQLADLDIAPFELVVVNLYPFTATVQSGATPDECVEQIDIGGPTMVRAAAKNHPSVAIVVDPERYADVANAVQQGGFTYAERKALAAQAFIHTATYDVAVASWMGNVVSATDEVEGESTGFPAWVGATWGRKNVLRYGENPHQRAALYVDGYQPQGLPTGEQLHGKEMSYNNYVDSDAAWRAAYDHDRPAVAIIKHANPCGIAVGESIAEAHAKAHACDPISAFGGVIAANRTLTADAARQIKDVFTEVVVAPDFEPEAVEILSAKKNIRLIKVAAPAGSGVETRSITGGMLMQATDRIDAEGDNSANWTLATGEAADEQTLADLEFAWASVRAVKSNAILLASGGASVGVGMGQVNRVDSCKLAVERANALGDGVERARGAVAASDAFFPFADGLQVLLDAGVKAVVQPGGSVRDAEVIEAARAAGVTLYLTGTRHFAH
ncbi:bifunctional phosphoribosylaminoimidazolecarboxamide formyltransferase/IMP cyclohydrolase [Timonella senegalensis]|uniref:bifunctional phosphoribosylaminoimidazolecarboxamide formyltransferase/IMP cyclohydrolase n=1 Tax=Timonella senegalensis TaxID=1465825 RepID=UPI0002DB1002|nr:bifunctional phosphoribosylaminoimidazolecarboxamide formyltransferase/IMP cyclohydrolase [Timonella senegalensis]